MLKRSVKFSVSNGKVISILEYTDHTQIFIREKNEITSLGKIKELYRITEKGRKRIPVRKINNGDSIVIVYEEGEYLEKLVLRGVLIIG